MQQFTVPQFIDVEAKVLGPITTRQFIIMLAGVVVMAISYKFFDFALFLTVTIFSLIIIGVFGFVKVNGRPFHYFTLNFIQTLSRKRLRVWNNKLSARVNYRKEETRGDIAPKAHLSPKRYATSRLAELSLIVDTGGAYHGGREENLISIETRHYGQDNAGSNLN
jgi:hypothetical protein